MILSNINKYKHIYKLLRFIKILNKTKISKQLIKKLMVLIKQKINSKSSFSNTLKTKQVNKNIIKYVINITSFPSNTIVNITDVHGKVFLTLSEGLINVSKESKKSKSTSVVKMFKVLLLKASFIKNTAVAINFKNVRRYQELLFIKVLKSKVFIKSVQSYTLIPHNGCRPKKLKKIKFRTKRLVVR